MNAGQVQAEINRENASVMGLQADIGAWRQRIAQLKEDRAGLEGFKGTVSADRGQFESALARKRRAAAKAGAVVNSRIAGSLADMLAARYGKAFEGNVQGCYVGVLKQVADAIADIDREIRQLGANVSAAEREITQAKRRIAVLQAKRDRLTAEEATQS